MRQKWLQKPPLGTPINGAHPSAKGLVGFWAFQEGGGDLANDLSGNANHGTLKNMAFPPTVASGWNPGKFGSCPKFDGTDDYVSMASSSSFSSSAGTIGMWINVSDTGTYRGLCRIYQDTNNKLEFYRDNGNAITLIIYDNSVAVINIHSPYGGSGLTIGWHHLVVVQDGVSAKIYIDGISQTIAGTNAGNWTSGMTSWIMNIGSSWSYYWNSLLDKVRIYNRALSEAEILDSYLNPFGMFERTKWGLLVPFGPPSGLSIPVAMHNYRRLRA